MDLETRRQYFADEIEIVANLSTPALIAALASVPRERFLPPGPWVVRSEADLGAPPRRTADADPRHVYHNLAIGIDPDRQLFNGAPSLLAMSIDLLGIRPGDRVLHLGTGLGYYTALIAHCTGPSGRVLGLEVDADLATRARDNLRSLPWLEIRHADGREPLAEPFDAMLINAGVTHPQEGWLDALAPGGRLLLPLTASSPRMGPIGKGGLVLISARPDGSYGVRMVTFVAIYSAVGLRDEAMNTALGQALMRSPMVPATRLRRDAHEPGPGCWLHGATCCFSLN
jgi:protein-L-isoaspartate(D-aspartate) O-methyltransferase